MAAANFIIVSCSFFKRRISSLTAGVLSGWQSINGPPTISGLFRAETWTCGVLTNDSMILRCQLAIYIAAVCGGIRCGHAYQLLTSGSAITFAFRYTPSSTGFLL